MKSEFLSHLDNTKKIVICTQQKWMFLFVKPIDFLSMILTTILFSKTAEIIKKYYYEIGIHMNIIWLPATFRIESHASRTVDFIFASALTLIRVPKSIIRTSFAQWFLNKKSGKITKKERNANLILIHAFTSAEAWLIILLNVAML